MGNHEAMRLFLVLNVLAYCVLAAPALGQGSARCAPDDNTYECLRAEAFWASQLAVQTSASQALAQVSARFSSGEDSLGRLVLEQQGLINQLQALERSYYSALGDPEDELRSARTENSRVEINRIQSALDALNARLHLEFPDYVDLTNPRPMMVEDVQALLRSDEALMMFLVADSSTLIFLLDRERLHWHEAAIGSAALEASVRVLRSGLDPRSAEGGGSPAQPVSPELAELRELLGEAAPAAPAGMPAYDRHLAYALYVDLFEPFSDQLAAYSHLYLIPSGALTSIPLGALVTQRPEGSDTDLLALSETAWLARSHAMTVLPAPASLRALARLGPSRARRSFLGVGDPCLGELAQDCSQVLDPGAPRAPGRTGSGFRGLTSTERLRAGSILSSTDDLRAMSALPNAGPELIEIASALGAQAEGNMYVRERATERLIKGDDTLADRRVLVFATHALVADEIPGLFEPALVLTPPALADEMDDGLLTASEIARDLQLDAEWVILSACNTAAPDGMGAESLSGLARAFFYAGARSLLVSHWVVRDDAARLITTRSVGLMDADPDSGRAGALRGALIGMMDDPATAHPSIWAPFILVGENRPVR
jgi:CHAT domain-containing protein